MPSKCFIYRAPALTTLACVTVLTIFPPADAQTIEPPFRADLVGRAQRILGFTVGDIEVTLDGDRRIEDYGGHHRPAERRYRLQREAAPRVVPGHNRASEHKGRPIFHGTASFHVRVSRSVLRGYSEPGANRTAEFGIIHSRSFGYTFRHRVEGPRQGRRPCRILALRINRRHGNLVRVGPDPRRHTGA